MNVAVPTESASVGRRRELKAAIVIFLAAFGLRLALVLLLPDFDLPITGEMERVAASFATTGQLANPYLTPTGPTAHVSPLYPLVLGSIYRLFGTGAEGHLAQEVFGCVLSASRCALMVPLAVLFGLGFRTGMLAGALSVGYISAFNTELRGAWEAPLAALFLMAMTAIAMRFSNAPTFGLKRAAVYGAFGGIGILLSPTLAPPMVAFLACTVPLGLREWRRYAAWISIVIVSAFLVVLPWLIRNQFVMGSPVVRSNFGLELSLAYNDHAKAGTFDPTITDSHPLLNPPVSHHVAKIGEIAFNREREKQALNWIRQHPDTALHLFLEHVIYFWFPPSKNVIVRAALYGITLFSVPGLFLVLTRTRNAGLLIGLIWMSFPLIYYVTYWSSRYRYPIEWTFVLCSAVLADAIWRRVFLAERSATDSANHCVQFSDKGTSGLGASL